MCYNTYMNNKTIIGIIVALLVVLGLAWWSLSDRSNSNKEGEVDNNTSVLGDQQSAPSGSLTVNHYFSDGSHTIEGTITLPTPCHTISHDVLVAESFPEQVSIALVTKPGAGLCTQVLADKFFRITFNASKDAVIRATLDGQPITLIYSDNNEGITK